MAGVNLDNALMPRELRDEFDVKLCALGFLIMLWDVRSMSLSRGSFEQSS